MRVLFIAAFVVTASSFVAPAYAAGSMDKCMGVGFSSSCCSKAQAKGLFAGDDSSSVAQRWDFLGKCKAGEGDKPKKK